MNYNTGWQPSHQPDPNRVTDAMRRFFRSRDGGQGDGYSGYDNRYDGDAYNRGTGAPSIEPPPYREDYRWRDEPRNTMGFNPSQNVSHEYGRPHREYQREESEFDYKMDDYFRRIKEGRTRVPDALCDIVSTGVSMYMGNSGGGSRSEWHSGGDEEQHMRYKEAIERLREEKDPNGKERLMKELFENLTPDEMVVLKAKAQDKSYHQLAREKWGNNASADRWMHALKGLKHKLKQSA